MSKLDELIQQYCPNGVEYKTLGEVSSVIRGERITKNDLIENGEFPVMSGGTSFFGRYNNWNREANTITIAQYGSAGYVDFITERFWANDVCYSVLPDDFIDKKFLYYVLCNNQKLLYKLTTKAIPDCLPKERLESIQIPIPPLPVQEEIVRILDTFTSLTAELTAELTARRKQYEYYRDELLTRETKVEVKKLGELFDFRNGLSKGKEFFGRGVPFITYSDVYNKNFLHKSDINALVECTDDEKSKLHVGRGDVLFTRTSETAEDVGHSSVMLDDIGDCVFNGFTIKATPKTEKLLPEYCAYCFNTYSFRKYVTANCAFTTRASLTGATIAEYEISIPSLEVQQRIVDVLDNFDSICSDLNIGLPAEINARKKQYEYYRDLLLTFAERGNTISSSSAVQQFSSSAVQQFSRIEEIRLLQYVFGYAVVRLGEIAKINRGVRVTRDMLDENGTVPVYQNSLVPLGYFEKSNRKGNTTFIISAGAAGQIGYSDIDFWSADDCFTFDEVDNAINKYIYYFLQTKQSFINSRVRRGSIPRISREVFEKLEIQLPTLEEQKRIVSILDRFDSLCNDISSGLPAEIEARQKQYEYYRDKILNFRRK